MAERTNSNSRSALDRAPHTILPTGWSIADARECYGLDKWGAGYFGISENGNVTVQVPGQDQSCSTELVEIVDGLKQRGIELPVMIRVENLLTDRVRILNETFQNAIQDSGYQGTYRGVYPIKVNQQRHVIDQLVRCGEEYGHGLEVGSKAELIIAMASLRSKNSLIICNGYKDQEFVDLGLHQSQLGFQCCFVIENLSELDLILDRSAQLGVEPFIGVRVKLATKVDGHWQNDSGDRSLFGLNTIQLIKVVDRLRSAGKLHCLKLLHFHLGSQIPNIRNIRDGVHEACRYYIDLIREGAGLEFIDLGGGLAVDYDGSYSTSSYSRNYDLPEYCADIVETLLEAFEQASVKHPTIVTESGRWAVAPMSILLFDVLRADRFESVDELDVMEMADPCESVICLLETLSKVESSSTQTRRIQENYNDAIYYRDHARRDFLAGKIDLREKSVAENLALKILNSIAKSVEAMERPPLELMNIREALADIYFGNFSVFQSLPDAWAIDQVFPVAPIHRLDERPNRHGIVADLTCDCDGKLDRFGGDVGQVNTLRLHDFSPDREYILGVFLVGAYQETLGDLHNLFGDTNVASVRLNGGGQVEFLHEINGDSVSDVLQYVEYQPDRLYEQFRELAENGVKEGKINLRQRQSMLGLFSDSLRGVTYFKTSEETGS